MFNVIDFCLFIIDSTCLMLVWILIRIVMISICWKRDIYASRMSMVVSVLDLLENCKILGTKSIMTSSTLLWNNSLVLVVMRRSFYLLINWFVAFNNTIISNGHFSRPFYVNVSKKSTSTICNLDAMDARQIALNSVDTRSIATLYIMAKRLLTYYIVYIIPRVTTPA